MINYPNISYLILLYESRDRRSMFRISDISRMSYMSDRFYIYAKFHIFIIFYILVIFYLFYLFHLFHLFVIFYLFVKFYMLAIFYIFYLSDIFLYSKILYKRKSCTERKEVRKFSFQETIIKINVYWYILYSCLIAGNPTYRCCFIHVWSDIHYFITLNLLLTLLHTLFIIINVKNWR
jgi:hypothetical protein